MLTINVDSATLPTQLPGYQGKCWQWSYPECTSQCLAWHEAMGRGKINFFDVLHKYEYWKGKCVKSVVGEFSSGVPVCPNKNTQSDLGVLFWHGGTEGLSSDFSCHCHLKSILDPLRNTFL